MIKALSSVKENNLYKYLICDQNKKIIYCITDSQNKSEIENDLKERLSLEQRNFQLKIIFDLTLKEELFLIWPQIIKDFESYFSFSTNWLKRAQLFLEDQELKIKLETKMAQKKLAQPKVINFLENNIGKYLSQIEKVTIHNGDFLPEIEQKSDPSKFKQRSERTAPPSQNKSNGGSSSSNNRSKKKKNRYGRVIRGQKTHNLKELDTEIPSVIVEADLFEIDVRQTRKGSYLYILKITDYDSSVSAKCFSDEKDDFLESLSRGDRLKIRGKVAFDPYSKEWGIMFNDLTKLEKIQRQDQAEEKRVELHLHTQMSSMDSVINVKDVVKRAGDWGHKAIAITDHGVVQAFPDAYAAGQKHDVQIIYGVEAYLVDDGEPIINNSYSAALDETEFIVFDLETTGLNPSQHEIIEIGAVKLKAGEKIDEFKSFINPGVKIKFEAGGGIQLISQQGALIADGNADNKILFTATDPQPGWWDGIWIKDSSNLNNKLDNVIVEYGGNEDVNRYSSPANVIVGSGASSDSSSIDIINSTLSYSDSYGLYVFGNGEVNDDWETANEFENNADGKSNIK